MKPKPKIKISKLAYVPIGKLWRRLKPLYKTPQAERIWRLNMRDFAEQRAVDRHFHYKHDESKYCLPRDYDSCDWRYYPMRHGRHPGFWDYVCHSACHWLVDLNLHVAMIAFPKWQWRIVTQRHHSTVWNGDSENPVLFDLNFLALGVTAKEAWKIASRGRFLKPGKPLRPYVFLKGYFTKQPWGKVLMAIEAR